MVVELTVENIAIIERAQITLGPGLTVLTGETGAGKSLLVDAIELAFGARADSDLVRSGVPRASVAVAVDVSASPALRAVCAEMGAELEDSMLYLHREVFAEGRSQCRIGTRLAPVASLRRLGQALVDLHGQHAHQSLLDPATHLALLDGWIGAEAHTLRDRVAELHAAYEKCAARLRAARAGQRDMAQRRDMLRFQVEEIEAVGPIAGEAEELEGALGRLQHADHLAQTCAHTLDSLRDGDDNAHERLGVALRALEDACRLDPSLSAHLEDLRAAHVSLEDGVRAIRHYADGIEADPQRLEETAARLDSLRKLRRKYGDDEAAVLAFVHEARLELDAIEGGSEDEQTLLAACESAETAMRTVADALSALRVERAGAFSAEVAAQLSELAMEGAQFVVGIEPKTIEADGADAVHYQFSANVGEPLKPLAKIASGGEISRVMLATKTVMAGRAGVPTLIFDEVDTGLGGRAAAVVAQKLEDLGRHYQVVAITHLPQIASRATTHYRIEKTERAGRVATTVRALDAEERVEEIARMIAGEQVGESARAHAREMLASR